MELPPDAEAISLLGVNYARLKTKDGGDLYLTQYGLPLREYLIPENWYASEWFSEHRMPLEGTSSIYRLPTKSLGGRSLDLVVRFSRIGQEIPLGMQFLSNNVQAEFNSPFEEFAVVMALRSAHRGTSCPRTFTKRPLAIYVPATLFQDWQTGRLESKMAAKRAQHPEVKLESSRLYILLYGWIHGSNAVQTASMLGMEEAQAQRFLHTTTLRVINGLAKQGFRVLDIKPEHVVLRIRPDGSLLRRHSGELAYALVDYELLEQIEKRNSQSQSFRPNPSCVP